MVHAAEQSKTVWEDIVSRTRVRTFSELMTSSLADPSSVPTETGEQLDPMNAFNILWMDYEFAKDWRALYFQRMIVNLTSNEANPGGFGVNVLNPRFGLRRTNAIPLDGFSTTWDLYVQPGITTDSQNAGHIADLGLQMANSYRIKGFPLTVGLLADIRGGFFNAYGRGSDFMVSMSPWLSFELTPWLSTQHWFGMPIRHVKGADSLSWNYPFAPNVQNGLGFQIGDRIWSALMVNNYLTQTPGIENTWLSLWLAVTIL
jgi:hypothetical protein